jgi:hypothetical protein
MMSLTFLLFRQPAKLRLFPGKSPEKDGCFPIPNAELRILDIELNGPTLIYNRRGGEAQRRMQRLCDSAVMLFNLFDKVFYPNFSWNIQAFNP